MFIYLSIYLFVNLAIYIFTYLCTRILVYLSSHVPSITFYQTIFHSPSECAHFRLYNLHFFFKYQQSQLNKSFYGAFYLVDISISLPEIIKEQGMSLSLSLSLFSLSPFLSLSPSPLSLFLSLSLSPILSLSHLFSLSLFLSHYLSLTLSLSLYLIISPSIYLTVSLYLSISLARTHTHTNTIGQCFLLPALSLSSLSFFLPFLAPLLTPPTLLTSFLPPSLPLIYSTITIRAFQHRWAVFLIQNNCFLICKFKLKNISNWSRKLNGCKKGNNTTKTNNN